MTGESPCMCDRPQYAKGLCKKCYLAQWHIKNHCSELKKYKQRYNNNKDTALAISKQYYHGHKDYWRAYYKKHDIASKRRERYACDINFKIQCVTRAQFKNKIKNKHVNSIAALIGCTVDQFRRHIESLFKPGMTWDNWSRYGWHLDHIVPLSSFNFSNDSEIFRAWHFTNLQPLWWYDNLAKSNKIK